MGEWSNWQKAILALGVVAICITNFRELLAWFTNFKAPWTPRTRKIRATAVLLLLILGSYLMIRSKSKVCASKQDYLRLREVATDAYRRQDYNSVIGIMSWVQQFQYDDDSMFRLRALAYKRLGDYRREIADREKAFHLNPGRERNHLPIVEGYILLRENDNAEAWMQRYRGVITNSDTKTMFDFLYLICGVLKGNEHSSRVAQLKGNNSCATSKSGVCRIVGMGAVAQFH